MKMKDSGEILENYEFIIVDDSRDKIDNIRKELTSLEVLPRIVTGDDDYMARTFRIVKEAYKEDKIPFLFLDEYLDIHFSEYGSSIAETLIEFFGEKGGVIFPTSESLNHQLWKIDFLVKDSKDWYIERDSHRVKGENLSSNINEICKEYFFKKDKEENNSEIKNG
ncbi:MAG: hypothetical protein RBS01_00150 [Candidatus Dojkabacteria bacterium]|jgi:hypothetical protein|nr:hypothetical protein [Candidatus Dojkabacteria bacterium]